MSKIFTRTFRVRWAEMDPSGAVAPSHYLRYIVETAWDWGVAIGWDADYSKNTNVFWLIREADIQFLHPLRHNDVFDLTIWLASWQKVRGTRCFELKLKENGEVIAQGTQQVVYMDAQTGRPKNLPDELIDTFRIENPRVFPSERFPKVTAIKHPRVTQRQVETMDLDVYDHVNNAIYIDYAMEAAAQDFSSRGWSLAKMAQVNLLIATRRVRIQYSAMAEWGETLTISTHPLTVNDTGGSRYVGITRAGGSSVAECILDWGLVDRNTGEPRSLPDALR